MQYNTKINWQRTDAPFNAKSFDRTHQISLGSGITLSASSAPEFLGRPDLANPEELFTASIASCFMLTFLYWAAVEGIEINEYSDEASGKLAKNSEGKMAMTEIILQPKVVIGGSKAVDQAKLDALFKKAHDNCFISSSVKTQITVKAQAPVMAA